MVKVTRGYQSGVMVMKRCYSCGSRNDDDAEICSECNSKFEAAVKDTEPSPPLLPVQSPSNYSPGTLEILGVEQPIEVVTPQPSLPVEPVGNKHSARPFAPGQQHVVAGEARKPINVSVSEGAQVVGTVIQVEQTYEEPPDFDPARFSIGILLILILFPVLISCFAVYMTCGLALLIIGLGGVFAALNPLNALGILYFLGLGGKAKDERVPVRNFRVRDDGGNEYQIRMKGQSPYGNVSSGDILSIWGKWRGGVLLLARAFNHRTNSMVTIRQSSWGIVLIVLLCLILTGGIYIYMKISNY